MAKHPDVIPLTVLARRAESVVERARSSGQPIVITQRGQATGVLLSVAEYERSQRAQELLLIVARGEAEISEHEGHTVSSVIAEAEALLAD